MGLGSSETRSAAEEPSSTPTLDTLYRVHAGTVARWAAKLAGRGCDLEDLVHEVFLVVRRRLPEFRGDAKVTTWLYRITERVALRQRRKDRFRRWFGSARQLEIEDAIAPSRLTPVDDLERCESKEACYRILDRMPDKYRTVLILFELEELSGEEIAILTGSKLATVWVRLHRARARFLADLRRKGERYP